MQTTNRTLKEKQRQEREELILKVAEEVLLEKGYHETSMDEIAARVGIAKGTVYLHFPSKEDLVIKIFDSDMQTFLSEVDAAIASHTSSRAQLEALLHFMYTGIFRKRAELLSTIYNSADLKRTFIEKGGCLKDLWDKLATVVNTILENGKQQGEIATDIPTRILTSTFFCLLSPRMHKRFIIEEHMSAEQLVPYIIRIYFYGAATQSPHPSTSAS